jgi:TonB family protein
MRTCPKCGASYNDDLSYCLHDGTRLPVRTTSDLTTGPTAIYHPETTGKTDISTAETIVSTPATNPVSAPAAPFRISAIEPASRMGCVLTFGKVAAGLLVVAGLGFVGLIYTFRGTYDLAQLKPAPAPANRPVVIPTTNANSGTGPANSSNRIASPTPAGQPKTVSGGVLNAQAVSLPKPPYPIAARAVKASGTVSVQVLVDVNGDVVSANPISGHPLLRSAAVQAAKEAKFKPTLVKGEPVKVSGVITYDFVP